MTSTSVVWRRAIDVEQQVDDVVAGAAVEIAGRLVGEQDRRIVGERAGDRHALLLAARQLRRIVMAAVRSPTSASSASARAPGIRRAGNLHRHQHVLAGRQRRQQVEELEDEADPLAAQPRQRVLAIAVMSTPSISDAPGRRRVEPGDQPEQRRLAAAGRPGDRDDTARAIARSSG